MPGLLRGVARTAVVAGTATAVSNRVSRRQAGRWSQQAEQQQPYTEAPAAPQAPPPPAPAAPAAVGMDDKIGQLKELSELKAQGILTEEEFAAQKARILNS
ncbi:SHOCT domain-containing protein [Streptomyces sp. NPDC032472]|uniref:SHOCT domain-containing protein n=1 Tax=Streptomyces sp. NPDC032472 TaxID=3155018 RepID=UPI0033FBF315